MQTIQKLMVKIAPSLAKKYKRWKKRRDLQRKKELLGNKPAVSKEQLVHQLKAAGITPGATFIVHSSLSAIGPISGGARSVIESLQEVIGPGGTMLMPTNTVKTSMLEFVTSNPCIDLRTAPSCLGVISEMFRTYPGVLRSTHPTHSVCGIGPRTMELFSDSQKATTPCGDHTPYYRLAEMEDAWIIHLGSNFLQTTLVHTLEDMASDFPVKVYLDKKYTIDCIDTQGKKLPFTLKVHDPAISKLRLDQTGKNFRTVPFFITLKERSEITEFVFGNGSGLLFRVKDFIASLERLLRLDITIYQ